LRYEKLFEIKCAPSFRAILCIDFPFNVWCSPLVFKALQAYLERALNEQVQIGSVHSHTHNRETEDPPAGGGSSGASTVNQEEGLPAGVAKMSSLLRMSLEVVDLTDAGTFYGLNERVVAAESCWFSARVSYLFSFSF
jgi:hypothetical protein